MKKRIIISFNLILILLFTIFCTNSLAESEIDLIASKNNVAVDEEFNVTVNANNKAIAAYTIWIYFDNEKVDCILNENSLNAIDNRVIYTWISETGRNENLNELVQITFKAKQEGIASFSIIGEFYNENGETMDIKYNQVEVEIGENYLVDAQAENEKLENSSQVISDNNAKLKIMRLNEEGVNPNFNQDINEYYLIVNENTEKLDVTAIPENDEAEVKISGNDNLKNGLNKIKITVTSKDKTNTEEYVINVTKTNNKKDANADLETLAVENYTLSPDYQNIVTNYTLEITNTTEKLNILAIPQSENAKVQIQGNENLKIGQNQVIITVTAANEITNKKYIIDVHRRNEEEETEYAKQQKNIVEEANEVLEGISNETNTGNTEEINTKNSIFMIVGIILSIIVIGIVIIRIRREG